MDYQPRRGVLGRYDRLGSTAQRKFLIGALYCALGLTALVVSFFMAPDQPPWDDWVIFAGLYVLLEFFAVEVNDRMMQSSSVMVIMTAGVIFATEAEYGAMFAMALMGALGPLTPGDFKKRRLFQPLANFGQMALAAAVAGFILDEALGSLSPLNTEDLLTVALWSSLAALAFGLAARDWLRSNVARPVGATPVDVIETPVAGGAGALLLEEGLPPVVTLAGAWMTSPADADRRLVAGLESTLLALADVVLADRGVDAAGLSAATGREVVDSGDAAAETPPNK